MGTVDFKSLVNLFMETSFHTTLLKTKVMSKYILLPIFLFTTLVGSSQTASISGTVNTHTGTPIPNTTVSLKSSNFDQTVLTDATGIYLFSEVPTGESYTLEMEREGEPLNGVSTFDMVQVLQSILAINTFDTSVEMLAADVDQSGTVSIRDAWIMRQVIIGFLTDFEAPNWRFVPMDYSYPNVVALQTINLSQDIENLNFIGVKAGDVSGNAGF